MKRTTLVVCMLLYPVLGRTAETEMPAWVLHGILKVETQSYYTDKSVTYIDTRRGKAGERGPFQMGRAAFDQVSEAGEKFADLETDTAFAEKLAIRYLKWIHTNYGKGSWTRTVAMWNTGPTGYRRHQSKGDRYAEKVKSHGQTALENEKKNKEKAS